MTTNLENIHEIYNIFLPEESHERRYYQSFQSFSPFLVAEALEDGEAAMRYMGK